ncbi:MAG TPA: ABC transporter substrate binding protein [Myxococcaceae bacterium]|nr:ABC transporter substrate binding protein [Myxococcaceae bacterium]
MMDRRAFITVVGGSILAAPLAAESQPPAKIPRLGYLVLPPLSEKPSPEREAFLAGLHELGWVEGKTIIIDYRSAQSNPELIDDLAEELARMKVDVIVTAGSNALLRAAARATSTIPIVMPGSADPITEGFVASLARQRDGKGPPDPRAGLEAT